MRGRVILAGLVAATAIGLTAPAVPLAAATAPAPATPAAKVLKKNRKLAARLAKCRRRLISCHEKRDLERNEVTLRDVVGGLGWIFGLCGLGLAVGVLWRDRQKRTGG